MRFISKYPFTTKLQTIKRKKNRTFASCIKHIEMYQKFIINQE